MQVLLEICCSPHTYFPIPAGGETQPHLPGTYRCPKGVSPPLASHRLTPQCDTVKHQCICNETRILIVDEYQLHPRRFTLSVDSSTVYTRIAAQCTLCHGVLISEVFWRSRWKDDFVKESRREIRHALEVCRGGRFSVEKDIRQTVLPFVRFLPIIAFTLCSPSRQSLVILLYDFIILPVSRYLLSFLPLPIKVFRRFSVTKNQTHARPPNLKLFNKYWVFASDIIICWAFWKEAHVAQTARGILLLMGSLLHVWDQI